MTSKEFIGAELERAYAEVLGGRVAGGFNDQGMDIVLNDESVPVIQVKSSVPYAMKFLTESVRRHQFIPICVGEPGRKDEVLATLKKFGGWVGYDIPRRGQILEGIRKVKTLCT